MNRKDIKKIVREVLLENRNNEIQSIEKVAAADQKAKIEEFRKKLATRIAQLKSGRFDNNPEAKKALAQQIRDAHKEFTKAINLQTKIDEMIAEKTAMEQKDQYNKKYFNLDSKIEAGQEKMDALLASLKTIIDQTAEKISEQTNINRWQKLAGIIKG